MVENLRLYINGKLVEFSTDPKVLYTYQATDVTNPTAVKNSFSKTVTIDGTPNNNDIFGHYWNIERYLLGGGEGGAFFNSSKKAPFELYIGSDLYEEGYCKLDSINRNGGEIKYNVTLYGGLGDFFFQLSTAQNGSQKKLSDLTFMPSGGTDEFDFTMNIDTVNRAWGVLSGGLNPNLQINKKWQYINFMPAYNGLPEDFDADKVIINLSGTSLTNKIKDDDKTYQDKQGFTVGTLPQEMTEWDTRDLRSYLQRPCIRMKEIINACCNPDNNGGYTVNLDPDFFSTDNPYWQKTWLSLPLVTNLEYSNDQQILEGASLTTATTTGDTDGLMYQDIMFDLGEINGNVSNITVNAQITPYLRYPFTWTTSYVWWWNWNAWDYHTGWFCLGSLFCQLVAVNGDTVVGASEVYNLTTPVRHYGGLWYGNNKHYAEGSGYDSSTGRRKMGNGSKYYPYMDMPIYDVLGKFTSAGFVREISYSGDESTYDTTPYTFTFNIRNIGTNVTGLKMVYYWGATADKVNKMWAPNKLMTVLQESSWMFRERNPDFRPIEVDEHNLTITSHNLSAVMGESLGRTGTKVNKQLLLNTESSPCDYLLSYCKMFGLHFTKDIGSKTINILTRKSFYQRDNIVDLNDYIDHSKQIDIQPIMFKSKWYQFVQEKDETQLQQKYLNAKGVEYGCKIVDTGYEFNAEKIDLLEDNCIRSGIEALEKSKWFIAYNNDDSMRPWMNVGLKYTLWNGSDEFEVNAGVGSNGNILPINEGQGMKYYDIFPKLQFHDSDNAATDGSNCLVFYSGFKHFDDSERSNPLTYILSDDSVYQTVMNEGTPCWLFSKYEEAGGKQICKHLTSIPVFERYLTSKNSGTVSKSLDFGSAQELYIPNYSLTDETNIYHNFWRTYLTDLFDVNTKQMTCYVKINTNPGQDWLRRFYWFDNAIWCVNKIYDWNPASYETTKVEFIKVQDIQDYTSVTQGNPKTIELSSDIYTVPATGGVVTLTITGLTGNVAWRLSKSGDAICNFTGATTATTTVTGHGNGTKKVLFSPNTGDTIASQMFRVVRTDNGQEATVILYQKYLNQTSVEATPTPIVIPSMGARIQYNFNWFNQGTNYITGATTSGTISITADTTSLQQENKAIVDYGVNSTTGVSHGSIVFEGGVAQSTVQVHQMPETYVFSGAGATNVIDLGVTGATFSNKPYWINTVANPNGSYVLISTENFYESGRTDMMTIILNGSSADFNVTQGVVNEFNVTRIDGSGNVLVTGGTIQLRVTSTTGWTGSSNVAWAVLSSSSDTTSATITVTFAENTAETRDAVFTFVNDFGQTVTYTQTQAGKDAVGSLVSPEVLVFNASGGTSAVTVDIHNAWMVVAKSPWVSVSPDSGSTADVVDVTAQPYSGTEQRQGIVVFFDSATTKTYQVTVLQLPVSGEILAVNPSRLTFPASGGTILLTVISNTDWTIA